MSYYHPEYLLRYFAWHDQAGNVLSDELVSWNDAIPVVNMSVLSTYIDGEFVARVRLVDKYFFELYVDDLLFATWRHTVGERTIGHSVTDVTDYVEIETQVKRFLRERKDKPVRPFDKTGAYETLRRMSSLDREDVYRSANSTLKEFDKFIASERKKQETVLSGQSGSLDDQTPA